MSKPATPAPAMAPTSTATKRGAKAESAASAKKHHVCPVCERGFSTTGHLARHARVHTGERNHKCPFPGCETKCSRQDNLQQHYRIHLSPGSRRKSGRSVLRSQSTPAPSPPAASPAASCSNENPRSIREDSPPLSPPPLEDSRMYFLNAAHGGVVESPPNSPPPLVDAYISQRGGVEPYRSEMECGAANAYPQSHRMLPHIDTSTSKSRMGSPVEEYWSTSSASDDYGSASAYPSPSPYPSAAASTYPSPTTQYPPSSELQYPNPLVNSHPHPHTFRHASHSPAAAAVPVARSLTARHSIANIGAHVQPQRAQPHTAEIEGARQRPAAQTHVHQSLPQTPHYPPLSTQQQHSPQAYTVPAQQTHVPVPYAAESYQEMEMRAHPDTPSPPPSSHHSPQTPYTPFQEPSAVYAPAQAVYPAGGSEHGGMQYDDAPGQSHDMHGVYEHAAYQSPHESAYHGYATPSHSQAAPYVTYDARGHALSLAYSAVPAMQFHPAPEAPTAPLLLAALPSLRRESVPSENYTAVARRDSAVLPPASLSSLAGYAGRESEPRYGHAHTQSPSSQERMARENYVASYAPAPRVQAPYLHHPQPQPPVAAEYLAEYGHGWRVAEVQ
ncbi:hypothetical protein MVEN_00704500 [Mycena venus]|uniref:C2H2-type domain-containing protein n=1 Tax=Mycena venus TaxID=2733690 RepID=A0A8H6YEQ6_9AGAR|nr:hypothetical protein MVEN_00704500 [Mycena venus]